MLRCLRAINPARCCFTATDLEDSLAEIDSILNRLNCHYRDEQDPVQLHANTESTKNELEAAYALAWHCLSNSNKTSPDKQLIFLLADILRQYGQLCFNENYFTAKQILASAMHLQLYVLGLVASPIDLSQFYTLDDLKNQVSAKTHLFDFMDDLMLTTALDQMISAAFSDCLARAAPLQRLFILATTAKFLGLAYQQLDSYTKQTDYHENLLKQVFSLSESLLLLIDDERSQNELANLYFAAWPLLNQPAADADGTWRSLYEKTIAHNNSQGMQARVANKEFMHAFAAGHMAKAQKWLAQALALTSDMTEDFSPFLLASIHHNCATFYMEPQNFNIEKAETYLKKATDFACQARQAGEDRMYFAVYDERMAEVQYLMGSFHTAKQYIDRALATAIKYPESNETLLPKIETLKSIIDKTLKMGADGA